MSQKSLGNTSELQIERLKFKPILPNTLKNNFFNIKIIKEKITHSASLYHEDQIKNIFKNIYGLPIISFKKCQNVVIKKNINKKINVAVVFSGGAAPGGHNVIAGLFDGLKKLNNKNTLIGYLYGPIGILKNKYKKLQRSVIEKYRNTGGFDCIGSGRTKIETYEDLYTIEKNLKMSKIDALVMIGGDDTNTNAAILSEYLKQKKINKCIIGIPKTIDGDLKNKYIETSFGFDTATKIYSNIVGNICRDVNSSHKYWHFIRLMGRSASHITLEVALKTHPNILIIGEEIFKKNMTLNKIVENIVLIILKRQNQGKNFGVVLLSEGIVEFIPELKELIFGINDILIKKAKILDKILLLQDKKRIILDNLPKKLAFLMTTLPQEIALQLILDRDPHGNVIMSAIEVEKLLIQMVQEKISKLANKKNKHKFLPIAHFFGYEGRCGMPSNFDANYAYALGYNAVLLIIHNLTGYMSCIKNLTKPANKWKCFGIPITMMMNIEKRNGNKKPVIQKTLVDLNGRPFKKMISERNKWAFSENYISPGPIQYFGTAKITDEITKTLQYEQS
ncbi:MAG: diphosphate--fructose-6-phosphate 1-phosphotransferase [Endomicrobium sp.]|jgi:pyrophosphate--fructose-6-phosphate 1-phosphotransferase|nr:diphosphate--fructose-6-phosphate 1-phosphotransferase [Endomicrobium sp.]